MTTAKSREASSFISPTIYDVFLSFRGEDTRETFIDHLYAALVSSGFRTFKDDNAIDRGEDIKSVLIKAIQQSKSAIVVISRNYANSSWCLDKLVMIMERNRTKALAVLPVFYHIDPSQVKAQKGEFYKEIEEYEKRYRALDHDEEGNNEMIKKVQGWMEALKEVAEIGGMIFKSKSDGDREEVEFIRKVIRLIEDKASRTVSSVAAYLVGINYRVKDINSWLQDSRSSVDIVAISGMSGIGKTTMAKFVFSLNHERFQASSFLSNVREVFEQPNGLIRLQRRLLSDLTGIKQKIHTVDEGIVMIKDVICRKKVLIILDDVDREEQVHAILEMRQWLGPGSKIIITLKNVKLLKDHEIHKIHEVDKMGSDESLELFSWYAFGEAHPKDVYMDLSLSVVKNCGGLPLALQVIGSSLRGKSIDVWRSQLKKLEAIPDNQILNKLKISYNYLQDDYEKNLFLDIACFFTGKEKDYVIAILDKCDSFPAVGIQNLVERCLLTVEKNKLMMHQMVRDMGRELVRLESPKKPGMRTRLWHSEDSFNVLREDNGTDTIEGLVLDMNSVKKTESFVPRRKLFEELIDKSLPPALGNSLKRHGFNFLSLKAVGGDIRNDGSHIFMTDAFKAMSKLKFLRLSGSQLTGSYKKFPKKLRWLCWHGFPLKSLPNDFPLEGLVAIDMRNSLLKRIWEGTRFLQLLKFLNLSHCHRLRRTPDFLGLPSLEKLLLKDSVNLVEIDESIGTLKATLMFLNLKDCKGLRKLPENICLLAILDTLIVSGCSSLEDFPLGLKKLKSLKVFQANGVIMGHSSVADNGISAWQVAIRSWMTKPRKIPGAPWVKLPHSIVSLSLAGCNLFDQDFPGDFYSLPSLQNLDLSRNPIRYLPDCIKSLGGLTRLELSSCVRLISITGLPKLGNLSVGHCTSLIMIRYKSAKHTAKVHHVTGCKKLTDMEGSFKIESASRVDGEIVEDYFKESMEDIEMTHYNESTDTVSKGPVKVLHENGLISIFCPGNQIPNWFTFRSVKAPVVSFTVQSLPNMKIQGLRVCFIYAMNKSYVSGCQFYAIVSNETKDLKLMYSPTCHAYPGADEKMIWFSIWKFPSQVSEGDIVSVSVLTMPGFEFKEVGVEPIYSRIEDVVSHSNNQELQDSNDSLEIDLTKEAGRRGSTRIYCYGHMGVSLDYLLPYMD